MHCPQCGNEIPKQANFCTKCGYKFRTVKPDKQETVSIEQEPLPEGVETATVEVATQQIDYQPAEKKAADIPVSEPTRVVPQADPFSRQPEAAAAAAAQAAEEIKDSYYYDTGTTSVYDPNKPPRFIRTLCGKLSASGTLTLISAIIKIVIGPLMTIAGAIMIIGCIMIATNGFGNEISRLLLYIPGAYYMTYSMVLVFSIIFTLFGLAHIASAIVNFCHTGNQFKLKRECQRNPIGILSRFQSGKGKYIAFLILAAIFMLPNFAFIALLIGLLAASGFYGAVISIIVIIVLSTLIFTAVILTLIGAIIAVTEHPYVNRQKKAFQNFEDTTTIPMQ